MEIATARPHTRTTLAMLWVFVLLNTLFRDVHEVFRPGFLDETLASGGTDDSTLVIAAVALQLPLAMVVLSGVLRRPVARWTNIAVAALTAVSAADTWPKDADDIVFALVQLGRSARHRGPRLDLAGSRAARRGSGPHGPVQHPHRVQHLRRAVQQCTS